MRIEGFVIHLARAEQRRPQVERLRTLLPVPVHIIDAIDGSKMTAAEIASVYRQNLYRPKYPFQLGVGEVGCFLSHRRAWQNIVDRGLDAGIVVEDDVTFEAEKVGRILELATSMMDPADFVRIPQKIRGERGPTVTSGDQYGMMVPRTPAFGMVMQVVGCRAAERLLKLTECFDRPVDAIIQMRWLHGLRILSARPAIISEISHDLGGTIAQSNRGLLRDTLSREVRRPIYRGSVRMRNWLDSR